MASIAFFHTTVDDIDGGDGDKGICMDLFKTFDSVSHDGLLAILKELGISGVPL